MSEVIKLYLPVVPRNSVITNHHLLKSFMEKMGIYEYNPLDEQIVKVKEHWFSLGELIEEIFEIANDEYIEYLALEKRVKAENEWGGDAEDRLELEREIAIYREKTSLTETYITDAYREIYLKYPDHRNKGVINWDEVDK